MYSLLKTALLLLLLFLSSAEFDSTNHDSTCTENFPGTKFNNSHCSNDSTCPTWFTCNPEKRCQCDNGHTTAILCDNQAQVSAILNGNCATYDSESKSIHMLDLASTTAYSAVHLLRALKNYQVIRKHLSTHQHAQLFIELAYCVVTVKRDTVHWCYHTISVVWSVQMDTKTGGSSSWLDLYLSQYSISS